MFQNMFPTISVANTQQTDCRRVVLLKFNSETQRIELRHYSISLSHLGLSKTVKRVVTNRLGEHLNRYDDVADFILRGADGLSSGSEAEDPNGETHIQLADHNGVVAANSQMAVRLVELGPRLQLQLVKVVADFFTGETIFHAYVHKTPEEVREQHKRIEKLNALKVARRTEQEKNVEAKKQAKAAKRHYKGVDAVDEDEDDLDNIPQIETADFDEGDDASTADIAELVDTNKHQAPTKNKNSNTSTQSFSNPQVKFIKRQSKKHEKNEQQSHGFNKKRKQTFQGNNNKRKKL